jgi:hypothetical protein
LDVEKYNLDIIALSETKKTGCCEEVLGNCLHLWSGVQSHITKWKSEIRNWRFMDER